MGISERLRALERCAAESACVACEGYEVLLPGDVGDPGFDSALSRLESLPTHCWACGGLVGVTIDIGGSGPLTIPVEEVREIAASVARDST